MKILIIFFVMLGLICPFAYLSFLFLEQWNVILALFAFFCEADIDVIYIKLVVVFDSRILCGSLLLLKVLAEGTQPLTRLK